MADVPVCCWCGQAASWNRQLRGWVCPEGEVISEATGAIIGSIDPLSPAVYAWREVNADWPEDADG